MKNMQTRRMLERDLDQVVSVLENNLGEGFVTRADLSTFVENPNKFGFVVVDDDERILGAVTSEMPAEAYGVAQLMPADARDRVIGLIPELACSQSAFLRSVAVSPQARGAGLGTHLVRSSLAHLVSAGATSVFSVGWTDDDDCHIQGPFEAVGFEQRGDLAGFWTADSLAKIYQCPSCGSPCDCTARLFVTTLTAR